MCLYLKIGAAIPDAHVCNLVTKAGRDGRHPATWLDAKYGAPSFLRWQSEQKLSIKSARPSQSRIDRIYPVCSTDDNDLPWKRKYQRSAPPWTLLQAVIIPLLSKPSIRARRVETIELCIWSCLLERTGAKPNLLFFFFFFLKSCYIL